MKHTPTNMEYTQMNRDISTTSINNLMESLAAAISGGNKEFVDQILYDLQQVSIDDLNKELPVAIGPIFQHQGWQTGAIQDLGYMTTAQYFKNAIENPAKFGYKQESLPLLCRAYNQVQKLLVEKP